MRKDKHKEGKFSFMASSKWMKSKKSEVKQSTIRFENHQVEWTVVLEGLVQGLVQTIWAALFRLLG